MSGAGQWSTVARELLSFHEMFRRMGFSADELFVLINTGPIVQFQLQHGGSMFTVDVLGGMSVVTMDRRTPEELHAEYVQALEWWNSSTTSNFERQKVFHHSQALKGAVPILVGLHNKGIRPPRSLN